MRWMNLELVIPEANQKEKNIDHMLTYIYGSRKIVLMKLFAGNEWRHRHRECTCGHSEGGGGGMD